jgi:hypothetical protein
LALWLAEVLYRRRPKADTPLAPASEDLFNVPDPNGYSIALGGGAGGTDYSVQLQLVTDNDPTNDISLTSAALGAVVTPLPAALPLFATGLGSFGLFGWRRKRKNAAAIAAA